MLYARLKKIAVNRGYALTRALAFKEEGGYSVSLQSLGSLWAQSVTFVSVAAAFPSKESCDTFLAMLRARKREFGLGKITPYQTGFQIQAATHKKRLPAFLDALPVMLRQSGARGSELCAHCHQELAPADSVFVNAYIPCRIHQNCLAAMTEKLDRPQYVDPENDDRHVGRGLIGALLGALIGAIPWILLAATMNLLSGWLGLLIGLAAAEGYKIFGGKPCKAKTWVVLLSILVGIAAGYYCAVVGYALIHVGGGLSYAISIAGVYFTTPDNLGTILKDVGLALFLAIICSLWLIARLHQESKRGQTKVTVIE